MGTPIVHQRICAFPISLYKLMERCAVQRGNPSMLKNVVPNVMARMPGAVCRADRSLPSVSAARARSANPEQPLANRDAKVAYSGLSMGHLLNLPFRLRFLHLLTRSCGKIGAGARRDASG